MKDPEAATTAGQDWVSGTISSCPSRPTPECSYRKRAGGYPAGDTGQITAVHSVAGRRHCHRVSLRWMASGRRGFTLL